MSETQRRQQRRWGCLVLVPPTWEHNRSRSPNVTKIGRCVNREAANRSYRPVCRCDHAVLVPRSIKFWSGEPEEFAGDAELERAQSVVGKGDNPPVLQHGRMLTNSGSAATSRFLLPGRKMIA